MVRHRSRVILAIVVEVDRYMTKTDHHRTALECMTGVSHAGSYFYWRCFPRVPAIAGCIGDGSGTCHLVIGQRDHL